MTLLAVFAIDDPIRPEAYENVMLCNQAGITMRLITSEDLYCARTVALRVGIIDKELALQNEVCMDGKYFKERVGGLRTHEDPVTGEVT